MRQDYIIGAETLRQFEQQWRAQGVSVPQPEEEINHFRFGNGNHEMSQQAARTPIYVGGRRGQLKAAIAQGSAPLLISRPAMQALKATIDFAGNRLMVFQDHLNIPLTTNDAGQYALKVMQPQPLQTDSPDKRDELEIS